MFRLTYDPTSPLSLSQIPVRIQKPRPLKYSLPLRTPSPLRPIPSPTDLFLLTKPYTPKTLRTLCSLYWPLRNKSTRNTTLYRFTPRSRLFTTNIPHNLKGLSHTHVLLFPFPGFWLKDSHPSPFDRFWSVSVFSGVSGFKVGYSVQYSILLTPIWGSF